MLNGVELIIFDCDGVLIDSEVLSFQALHKVLSEYNIHISVEDGLKKYVGRSESSTLASIQSEYSVVFPPEYLVKKRAETMALFEKSLNPLPGVSALVSSLPFKKCIASGSSPERLEHSLKLVGLWDVFAPHIFSATQVKNGKPAPDLFLFAAEQMSVSPSACLVIEDSLAGVQAARSAQMRVHGFTGGSHCGLDHGDTLLRAGAESIFKHMDDLATALHLPSSTVP